MTYLRDCGLCDPSALLLSQADRPANSGVQMGELLQAGASDAVHRVCLHKAVVQIRIRAGKIGAHKQGGVRPGGLREVFDGGADSGVALNQQHITRAQGGLQVQRVRWWRGPIDTDLFAQVAGQVFAD